VELSFLLLLPLPLLQLMLLLFLLFLLAPHFPLLPTVHGLLLLLLPLILQHLVLLTCPNCLLLQLLPPHWVLLFRLIPLLCLFPAPLLGQRLLRLHTRFPFLARQLRARVKAQCYCPIRLSLQQGGCTGPQT
jgi:hypothetical protein